MKLVLIEDNADLALTMRALLELRGYQVECYLNGQDFLREVDRLGEDDVVITDYYLPDLNGIDLLKQARAKRPGIKAILLTGSREEGIVRAARGVAQCKVEFKPLDYEMLDRRIQEVAASA